MKIDLLQFPKIERVLGRRTEEHRKIARRFDKEFFDGSRDTGYGGYRDDGRWAAVALRMKEHYKLNSGSRVMDIGCAKGFLVKEFLGVGLDAYGIDVSGYALANCPDKVGVRLYHRDATDIPLRKYALIVSINTLHNLERQELVETLRTIQHVAKHAYITVDAFSNDEEEKRMRDWNLTARTILHVDEWLVLFAQAGYTGDYDWWMP